MFLACVYIRFIYVVLKSTLSLLISYRAVAFGHVNLHFLNCGTGRRHVFNFPFSAEFTRVRGG